MILSKQRPKTVKSQNLGPYPSEYGFEYQILDPTSSASILKQFLGPEIQYICREGQLTHLFFPGRVGRGYGPDWTLVVVSPWLRVGGEVYVFSQNIYVLL